jgi:transcriptional regulator with XRE-family HTH domain
LNVELPGLKRVREARVVTQKQLAARSGVGVVTISRIENDTHPEHPGESYRVRPGNAHRLARALRVDLDELMSREGTGVPLGPLSSLQQKATELLMILERDALRAEEEDSDELRESVRDTALKAWLTIQRQRLRGEDVPAALERDYANFIAPFIERLEESHVVDDRADELMRELEPA